MRHPWDRFYHYQRAPWRGQRHLGPWADVAGPVLELGCGNGKLLGPLRARGLEVVGLDISRNVLRRVDGDRVLGDAAVLPFGGATFAAVMDIHCTGHLDAAGRAAALAEARRVLVPGGRFVLERLGPEDLRAGQGSPVEDDPGTRRIQDGRQTHFADQVALEAAVRAAGFVIERVEEERRSPTHRGVPVLRQNLRLVCLTDDGLEGDRGGLAATG